MTQVHTHRADKPSMVEIRPGHYVWANQAELERYKKRYEIITKVL